MVGRCAVLVLAACGSGAPSLPTNTAIGAANTSPVTNCTQPTRAREPLPRVELELRATPGDIDTLRARLPGVWDGHAFDIDGELGQPGVTPRAGDAEVACFDPSGTLEYVRTSADSTCSPRTRRYSLERDDDTGGELVLRVDVGGGCPGDAGYETPYRRLYDVSRLDDRVLVLVDGSTAAVTAYRRR